MQAEDGISLDTQKTRIQQYCAFRNLNLIEIYVDAGISAKDAENRPELQRLLKEVQKEEFVIITDISRLSRNTKDAITILEDFKKKNISLVSLDIGLDFSTSTGTMVFTILASVSKLERENIALIKFQILFEIYKHACKSSELSIIIIVPNKTTHLYCL